METIGVLVGVIGVLVGIVVPLVVYKKENPKRQLSFHVTSARLLSPKAGQDRPIRVTYAGVTVPNPHLVTVTLRSTGTADIASNDFDSSKPLRLDLETPVYGVASDSVRAGTHGSWEIAETSLILAPALLSRDLYLQETYLTGGVAQPKIEHHLINTAVISDNEQIENLNRRERSWAIAIKATALPMFIAGITIAAGALTQNDVVATIGFITFVTTFAIMFTLGLIAGRLHKQARALNTADPREDEEEGYSR